jgi:flagellar hook-length control protein FliK
MASVPNMRAAPAPIVPGVTPPALVDGAEFASLMPVLPEALLQGLPVAAREGGDTAGEKADTDTADQPLDAEAPPVSDAAQLAALLPVLPVPVTAEVKAVAKEAATSTPDKVEGPKVAAAPVAKAPEAPSPTATTAAAAAGQQAADPQPVASRKAGKPPAPNVAVGPSDSKTDGPQAEAPAPAPADKAIEAAKKLIEQALRPAAPAPIAGAHANVRPQNAPLAPDTEVPVEAATSLPAAAAPLAPAPAFAQAAPPPVAQAQDVQAPAPTDRTVERELDLARDSEWLDRLARDIARTADGDSPMRFKLHPQTLGHLRVELSQGDHGTSVRLTVETEAARSILTEAQPKLAAEARAQGVRIAETHVDLSGSGRHASGDQRRQDETRQSPIIRTAREAAEASAPVRPARSRPERYA